MKKKEVCLVLDSSYKIKYESISEFENSLFSEVYAKAVQIIQEIQKKNSEYHTKSPFGNERRNNEQIYNTLSFIGGRGTGKTSAMLSFYEYLKDYSRLIQNPNTINQVFQMKPAYFTAIDHIDAGLLENEEDLIEIILARMLHKLSAVENSIIKDHEYEYMRREFHIELRQVYKNLKNLKQKQNNTYWTGETSLDDLLQLSVSYNLRESMKRIVEQYLGLIRYKDSSGIDLKQHYLVIAVDDIDMLVGKGYQMLEQVRRYLMIPNVIVLLSFDYKQLLSICETHYRREFSDHYMEEMAQSGGDSLNWPERLSKSYLEKVIPDGMRIQMPSILGLHQIRPQTLYIVPTKQEGESNKNRLSIWEFISLKLARGLNIYCYKINGQKHFLEPRSLRNLSNYCHELGGLNEDIQFFNIPKDEAVAESQLEHFEQNYRWILENLQYRVYKMSEIPQQLKELFEGMQTDSLENQLWEITNEIREYVLWLKEDDDRYFEEIQGPQADSNLGVLLNFLYEYSDMLPDPDFSALLLVYFSVIISGKLYYDRLNAKETDWELAAQSLGLSDGFGSWDEIFLNWDKISSGNKSEGAINYRVGVLNDVSVGNAIDIKLKLPLSDENVQENTEALHNLELNLLFFRSFRWKDTHTKHDIPEYDWSGSENELILGKPKNGYHTTYRISNFIPNIYKYDQYWDKLHDSILSAYTPQNSNWPSKEELENWFNMHSIKHDFQKWEEEYGTRMVIPVQNLEFLYSLLQKIMVQKPKITDLKQTQRHLKQYFQSIEEELQNQTDYYANIFKGSNLDEFPKFPEIFKECPLIKKILGNPESGLPSPYLKVFSEVVDYFRYTDDTESEKTISDTDD